MYSANRSLTGVLDTKPTQMSATGGGSSAPAAMGAEWWKEFVSTLRM
jgi:hypothetical protein